MFAITMLKKVENPVMFHQALKKIEITFTVLHAVFARRIGASQAHFKFGRRIVSKDFFDNIRDRGFLENPVVGAQSQQP